MAFARRRWECCHRLVRSLLDCPISSPEMGRLFVPCSTIYWFDEVLGKTAKLPHLRLAGRGLSTKSKD
jgi:hypothetical protein